jgi:hypothetical protein
MLLDEDRARRWRRLLDGSLPPSEIKAADHYVLFTTSTSSSPSTSSPGGS